jgi:ADP-L-glycero-D-manno-heptose 6-epimerase
MPRKTAARPRKSRILVTGGAGFIGSALVHALNAEGIERIIISDILGSDDKWRNLVPLKFEDYFQADELLDRVEAGGNPFGKITHLFHLGACSSTTEADAAYLIRNNYRYTRVLAEWALARDIRFVHASSAATYGDGSRGMDDSDPDIDRLRPLNLYGYSKQLFDQHAMRAGYLDSIVGVKYFNVFGPNEYHKDEMRSLVCKAYEQIVQTGKIRLFKSHRPEFRDGEQMRDFIYVKDAVAMTLHLARSRRARGLYNVGSGVARTWLDLASAIFAALGRDPKIEFIDIPESIRDQYQYYTCADVSKLRAAGYRKTPIPLEDAVRDYVINYLENHARLGE